MLMRAIELAVLRERDRRLCVPANQLRNPARQAVVIRDDSIDLPCRAYAGVLFGHSTDVIGFSIGFRVIEELSRTNRRKGASN